MTIAGALAITGGIFLFVAMVLATVAGELYGRIERQSRGNYSLSQGSRSCSLSDSTSPPFGQPSIGYPSSPNRPSTPAGASQ